MVKNPSRSTWQDKHFVRVVKTAAREFWIPLLLALGFALWGVSGEQYRQVQGYFFGFLMLAWFTGQLVRIRREIERKDSTKVTLDRLSAMSEKLDTQLQLFMGHATGGDSVFKVYPLVRIETGDVDFAVSVVGRFPVRDVDVISQDLDVDPPHTTARHAHHEIIWPGSLREKTRWEANGRARGRYLMQLSAFNHNVFCEAVVERGEDGQFRLAQRQRVNDLPWTYEISVDFPGYDETMPAVLFKHSMPNGAWPKGGHGGLEPLG